MDAFHVDSIADRIILFLRVSYIDLDLAHASLNISIFILLRDKTDGQRVRLDASRLKRIPSGAWQGHDSVIYGALLTNFVHHNVSSGHTFVLVYVRVWSAVALS